MHVQNNQSYMYLPVLYQCVLYREILNFQRYPQALEISVLQQLLPLSI